MMTRSQFLGSFAGLGFGALALSALGGCSSSGDDGDDGDDGTTDTTDTTDDNSDGATPDAPGATCTAPGSMIGANHGHALVVSAADVAVADEKSYDISGSSDHPHTVVVTPAMFAMIAAGEAVTVRSSVDGGHSHNVTLMC